MVLGLPGHNFPFPAFRHEAGEPGEALLDAEIETLHGPVLFLQTPACALPLQPPRQGRVRPPTRQVNTAGHVGLRRNVWRPLAPGLVRPVLVVMDQILLRHAGRIVDHEPQPGDALPQAHAQVAGPLHRPCPGRVAQASQLALQSGRLAPTGGGGSAAITP
ncbi:unnamed protein product [[Actinomadura] parvosata subsp. kistnae]|nr:unnamed protein product [Actinomadura parvosata subsp. kistnae]